jgi:putative PEP-CTERM system TPR-repeat lipoprotein
VKQISLVIVFLLICTACSSKTKESLYDEGVKQLEASNAAGAVVYFKNALEKDGNFNDARFQLAKAYAAIGKLEQAEKEFSKVLKQNPSRDDASLELARLFNRMGKLDQAFRLGEQFLAKHPDDAEGLEVLGVSCAASKRYEEAERYLLRSLQAAPQRTQTKLELASVNSMAGQPVRAKALIDEVVRSEPNNLRALYQLAAFESGNGGADRAAAVFRKILQLAPDETKAQYKLGLILIEKSELAKAEGMADELIRKFPQRADGYRLKGLVSYYRRNFGEALASLQAADKLAPTLEGNYFLGLCHYNRGDLESALSQFRIILDRQPNSRQARLMTGQILLTQKRFDDAVAEIQKVLQRNDADAVAHSLLGTTYMSQGLFEEGMRELNRATQLDPQMVSAHMKKGYYYFSKGKDDQGETELASAVKAAPDLVINRLLLASYYQRQKKGDMALALLKSGLTGGKGDAPIYNALAALQFSSNKEQGIRCLEQAKQVDPGFSASYQNLATYYAASGDYQRAIDQFNALLRSDASSVKAMLGLAALYEITGKESEALAQYRRAAQTRQPAAFLAHAAYLQKKGQTDQALKVLDDAFKVGPTGVALLEMKGRLLAQAKRYREALKVFDQVEALQKDAGVALKIEVYLALQDGAKAAEQARRLIEKAPGSSRGYLVLASVYQRQNDLAAALREANNGIRAEAKSVEAWIFLGRLWEAQKQWEKALSCYQEALRLRPDALAARFARGALLDRSGRKKEAIKIYRGILEVSDSFAPALNNLAYLCAEGYGSPEEALRLAITAFRLDPGNAGVMDTVGFALLKNGRKAEALKVLERAVALLPQDQSVHYHLALAYKESGDRAKAEQALQEALSLGEGPDTKAVRVLLAELKR